MDEDVNATFELLYWKFKEEKCNFFFKSTNSCDQIPFETSVSGIDRHSNFKIVSEGRAVRIWVFEGAMSKIDRKKRLQNYWSK